jgi:hypothetical protein
MNKQDRREYEESIKDDVIDFWKEVAGVKKPEFPVGDTKAWREGQKKKKGRIYDDED